MGKEHEEQCCRVGNSKAQKDKKTLSAPPATREQTARWAGDTWIRLFVREQEETRSKGYMEKPNQRGPCSDRWQQCPMKSATHSAPQQTRTDGNREFKNRSGCPMRSVTHSAPQQTWTDGNRELKNWSGGQIFVYQVNIQTQSYFCIPATNTKWNCKVVALTILSRSSGY